MSGNNSPIFFAHPRMTGFVVERVRAGDLPHRR
jgi:hypothetical protein